MKSGQEWVLNSDSSAHCYQWGCLRSAFRLGSWIQRGDTVELCTYKYLGADTFSYDLNQDTTRFTRMHEKQIVIAVRDCAGSAIPCYTLDYYTLRRSRRQLKTSKEGEIVIPQAGFSGLLGPYDLGRFLKMGIRDIEIIICQDAGSNSLKQSPELEIRKFIKTENGLIEIAGNRLFERK